MFGLGIGELIIIAFVLVVVFSASRMGRLGEAVGKFVYSFKRASRGEDVIDVTPTLKRQVTRGANDSEPRTTKSSIPKED